MNKIIKSYLLFISGIFLIQFYVTAWIIPFTIQNYGIFRNYVSELALTDTSMLFLISMLISGSGSILIGIFSPRRIQIAQIAWGISVIIAGIFPTDQSGSIDSISATVHGVAAISGFLFVLASSYFARNKIQYGNVLFGVLLISTIIFFISTDTIVGLTQKIMISMQILFQLFLAYSLRNQNDN